MWAKYTTYCTVYKTAIENVSLLPKEPLKTLDGKVPTLSVV